MLYGGAPVELSRHNNGPLQRCSAYNRNRRFSSSVTSRPLYDDHDHHSIRRNARSPYNYGLCGVPERWQSFCGDPETALPCVPLTLLAKRSIQTVQCLGVVRTLYSRGSLEHCYFTETRPYNQGARLTACELLHDGIPSTLLCDSMVAMAMGRYGVDAVITGADRCLQFLVTIICQSVGNVCTGLIRTAKGCTKVLTA